MTDEVTASKSPAMAIAKTAKTSQVRSMTKMRNMSLTLGLITSEVISAIERPFSFRTSYRGFSRNTSIIDRTGRLIAILDKQPLREERRRSGSEGGTKLRSATWRPDGLGISYLQKTKKEGSTIQSDQIMLLQQPFAIEKALVIAKSDNPISSVTYTLDGAGVFGEISKDGESGLVYWNLRESSPVPSLLVDFHDADDGPA